MQHRIIVVDTVADLPVAHAQLHWRDRHPQVYAPAPLLLGYVQNRPLEEEWQRLGTRSICSETWFADREAERALFASDYYRDVVVPDEAEFLDRDSAWMARVVTEPRGRLGSARYRVLAFGGESLTAEGVGVMDVDRDPWVGDGRRVSSLWLDDRGRALDIARAATSFAFVAEPVVFVTPPG